MRAASEARPRSIRVASVTTSGVRSGAAAGRKRRSRLAELLVAAVALAEDLPLVTRNPADFRGLEGLVEIVEL